MKKIWLFLIISLVGLNLGLTGIVQADDGGYEYKGGWAGVSPEEDKYFSSPKGVAVGTDGNIFVADTSNHRIQKFDSTGKPILRWGSEGTGIGQFKSPADLAVDSSGYVYVLDTGNNRVQKFTMDGVFVWQWGGFASPQGIAVGTDNCVYVADTNNNRVQKFSRLGVFDRSWGSFSFPLTEGGFLAPQGIAIIGDSVYVADTGHNAIQRFSTTGTFTAMWGTTTLSAPDGIAIDPSGNIFVADTNNHRIAKFDSTGSLTLTFGSSGTSTGSFTSLAGIALDPSGNILVADTGNHRIQKFTNTGFFISTFGQQGNSDGKLNSPLASAIAPDGSIFVADTNNHQVQKFSATGTFISKWGSFGTATGLFNSPRGIAVDSVGNVYVCDSGNNRIQRFTANGIFSLLWTNHLNSPHHIALATISSQEYVFVVNTNEHRIEQFNTAGVFVRQFGSYGAGNGAFYWPKGIAIGTNSNIFVADTNNHRIQKFTYDGTYITQWGSKGTATGQLESPTAVSIDHYGYIYVADSNNNRIQKFSPSGMFITAWGTQGTGTGCFNSPMGISIGTTTGGHERVFVVDTNNHRIQYFEPTVLSVNTITPNSGSNTGTIACTITGAGFFSQVRAELYQGSSTIAGTTTSVSSSGTFTCTFNLVNVPWGSYSLRVINPNGTISTITKPDAFYSIDPIAPTIVTATTMDKNSDGWLDAIGITFSEPIKDTSVALADFNINEVGTPTGNSTGGNVNDNYFELLFANGSLSTSVTPTLTYTAGLLTDLYGNLLASTTTTTHDSARPVLKLVTPSSNGVDNNSIAVEYWLSEPCGSGTVRLLFQGATTTIYTLLGTNTGTTTTTVAGTGLIDGSYTVTIIATDMAGNAGTSNVCQNWRYDNTLPTLTLVKPESGKSDNEQIDVEYSLSEYVALLTITFNGTVSTTTTLSTGTTSGTHSQILDGRTLLGSSTGTYTVTLNATDLAGNTYSTTTTNWTYDTSAPRITLFSPGTNSCDNLSISVKYYLSKDVGSHSIWLMFYSPADTRSPLKANTIFSGTQGTHTAEITGTDLLSDGNKTTDDWLKDDCVYDVIMTAVDSAGNTGTSGTNTGWTYDITPPIITELSKPAIDGADNETIDVRYKLSENAQSVTMLFKGTNTVYTVATTTLTGNMENAITLIGSSSFTPQLIDGTYTVELLVTDLAGNNSSTYTRTNWKYDTKIGTPTLKLAGNATYTTSRQIDVLVSGDGDVGKQIISETQIGTPSETAGEWSDGNLTSFLLSEKDGIKVVYLWVKDKAGNINGTKSSIILDQSLPTITLLDPPGNTSGNGTITVSYWLSEPVKPGSLTLMFGTKSVNFSLGTQCSSGSHTVELNIFGLSLQDGATYTLLLTGYDLSGNPGTSNSQANWQYDITPPIFGLTLNTQDNQSIAIEYTLSENVIPSSLKATFGRGTWTAIAANIGTSTMGTWSVTILGNQYGLTDGTYTITLSATDMAGNAASTTVSTLVYDTQIGSITLSISAGSYTNQATIIVNIGTLTPQESGTISYLLGEEFVSIPQEMATWSTTKPATCTLSAGDGVKMLYLWVKDIAGNITQTPATASIILDTTTPFITLNKPDTNGFGNDTIALSYTLNETVKFDSLLLTFARGAIITTMASSTWGSTAGTHNVIINPPLNNTEGSYTVSLSAMDMAGNPAIATVTDWTYDTTNPMATLTMPAPGGINNQNIAVKYQLSEDVFSVELIFKQVGGTQDENSPHRVRAKLGTTTVDSGTITINGGDLNNDQNTTTNDVLKPNAVYNVWLEIVDRAGNSGSSSTNGTWTYDSQAPVLELIKPSTGGFDNDSIAVEYKLSESVSTSTLKLIFTGATTTTVPFASLTTNVGTNRIQLDGKALGLLEGTYSVRMEAYDLAGNKGESNISTDWIYDSIIPTATVSLAGGATYTKTTLVMMGIEESADVVNWYDSETQKTTPNEDSPYWNSKPSGFNLSSGDGTKTVYVWVKDRAGNIGSGTDTIILDTKPPVVTLNKPAQNGMDNGDILVDYTISESEGIASATLIFTWTGGASDGNHVVELTPSTAATTTLSGNSIHGGTSTESLVIGAIYMVSLQAVDLAGNVSTPDFNLNWKYDPIPPQIIINKPETNGTDNQSLAVNYTLSETVDPSTVRLIFISGTNTVRTVISRYFTGNMDNNTVILDGKALSLEGTGTWGLTHGATYTVKMSCADWAGNAAESNLITNWTYDDRIDNPGLFKIYDQNSGDGSITVSAVVRVEIESATETVGWLLSEVQTVPPAENNSSWVETKPTAFQLSVGNGTKTVYLWCKDMAGNISQPATATIKLDTTRDVTPPVISLILPASNGVDNGSIIVSYTLSEPCNPTTAILSFGTHTGTVTNFTGNYGANTVVVDGSIFELSNGATYTVTLSMVDYGGNRGTTTPSAVGWRYDTHIGTIALVLNNHSTYTNSAMVSVDITGAIENESVWIISEEHSSSPAENSGLWNSKPSVFSLSSGDGTKTVYLWVKDKAGNIGSATETITMDLTKPTIILHSPSTGGVSNGSITLSYILSENIGSGTLRLTFTRTGGATDTAHTCTVESVTAGSHEIMLSGSDQGLRDGVVYAVSLEGYDLAGNYGQAANTNWQYDISIATPTITLNQGASYTRTRQVVVSVSNDVEAMGWLIGIATGKLAENDPEWRAEEPTTFDLGTTDGTVSVYLWTKDAVGNISATATASIVLDTRPATVTLTMPVVDNQSITVDYSLSEGVASALISFAGNGQVVGTQLANLACGSHTVGLSGQGLGLIDGSYTVSITAVDFAGNEARVSNVNWRYDTTIPIIVLNKPATNGVDNQSIAVNCTASEALSSMMLVFSSEGMQVYTVACGVGTTTVTGNGLTHNATYTVQIVGTDTAGNGGASTMVSNWRYDNEVATPTLRLGSETVTTVAVVAIGIESATDTIGWWLSENSASPDENATMWLSAKPTVFQLSPGNNTKTVYLWVKDIAGNVSQPGTASIMLDTTQDTTLPTVNLITPATDGADNASIKVSYYLSEPCQNAMLTFGTVTVPAGSLTGQYGTNTITLDGSSPGLINGQTYTVSLSMADANGNRAISTNTNWTYDNEIAIPSFYLMNKITGSRMYTHTPRIDVSVREHPETVGWLISETLGTPTEEAVVNAKPFEFTLNSGDGTKTVYLWAKDRAGNVSSAATASIILNSNMDITPPMVNLISPASNGIDNESIQVVYTISEDVTALVLTFIRTGGTTDGSHSYTLGTECLLAGQHELVVNPGLQHGGVYSVSLKATDAFGNSGQGVSTNWRYDISIATPTLTLNNGAGYTRTRQVSVGVNNDAEAKGWLIGTATGKPVENDPSWRTEEPTTFDLGTTTGTVSVYLWTKDAVGNVSGTATASIVLDTVPATMTLTMPTVDNQSIAVSYQFSEPMATANITFNSPADVNSPHRILVSPASGSITLGGVDLNSDGERTLYDYLKDGATYTVTLEACDLAGNTSSVTTSWRYDNSISTPGLILSGAYTATRTITVTIDNDADISGWLISETQTTQPSEGWQSEKPATITLSSSDGIKHIYLWVKDSIGNICPSPAQGTIILDTISPQLELLKPEAGTTSNQLTIKYYLSEAVATETLRLVFSGQATITTGLSPRAGTHTIILDLSLPDGTYSVTLFASDIAGNAGSPDIHVNWRYDTTIDTSALVLRDQTTNASTCTTSSVVKVEIMAEGASYWLLSETQNTRPKTDDSGWRDVCPTIFTLSSGDGIKTVYLWVKDENGNVSPKPTTAIIMLSTYSDRQAPGITLKYPAEGGVSNSNITLNYTLSENIGTLTLTFTRTGGATDTVHTTPINQTTAGNTEIQLSGEALNLLDGAIYTVSLEGNDLSGNQGKAENTNWKYDTTIGTPSMTLSTITSSNIITVNINCEPDVAASILSETQRTKPSSTNTKWEAGTPTAFALSPIDGTKTIYLWVMDRAGNINGCSQTIVLDTTAPIITLNSPSTNGVSNGSITLSYTLSENTGTLTLTFTRIGGATDTVHTYPVGTGSKPVLTVGSHEMILSGGTLNLRDGAVYAVSLEGYDLVGNQGKASNTSWQYDTTPPDIRLVYPAQDGADNQGVWVEYWLSEDVQPGSLHLGFGTMTISNGLDSKGGKHTLELNNPGLINGATYTISLEAMDMAGNLAIAANSNWKYDVSIGTPSLSLTDRNTASGTFTTSLLVSVNIGTDTDVACWLLSESQTTPPQANDSGWLSSKPSAFSLSSGSGEKIVYLWVKDRTGNMSWAMDSIAIDTESPIIILSQPAAEGFGTQGVRVAYSLSEDIATGTLKLSFIRTGGNHDGHSPHRIVLTDISKGDHSFVGTYSLVDGAIYTITLEGEDTAGNKAQLATSANWTYDLSAPIITLVKPSSNGCDNHELELVFVLSENVKPESVSLAFNNATVTAALPYSKGTNTANINITGLGLVHGNTYTVTMQVEDMTGNPSAMVTKTNWTYDDYIGTPTITIATTTTSRLVEVKITDDNEAVDWLLGEDKNARSEGWRSTRPTAVYLSSAGAGVKQVDLWVRDLAGNVNHTAASILLTATSTSAQLGVSIQSPRSGDVESQIIHLQYTLTEPVDPESLRLVFTHSSGANDPNSPHTVTNGLEPFAGVHDILIKGYDLNLVDGAVYTLRLEAMAETAQVSNLRYDISPPIMSLISPATNGYGKEIITVRYQASEPLAGDSLQLVFYRGQEAQTVTTLLVSSQGSLYINGNDLSNDGSQTITDTLTNGATYTVYLTASDLAGNRAAPVTNTNWKYDTNIGTPTLTLSGGATYTNSSIVTVEATGDFDVAKWLISETQKVAPTMDNPMWTNKPTAYSFSIGEGKKTVYLWVQDGAGNINTTPGTASITMDTISPQITLNSPATNGAGNGTIAVSYYLSEAVAVDSLKLTFKPTGGVYGTECVIIAGLTPYRGENMVELNGLGLSNGTIYAVSLDATDFAGNIGITAVSHNWKYDTTIGMPTLLLRDQLTNGTQCTGARLVRVEISGDEEAVKWLVSEDMNAPDNKDLPWQQDKPAYFTLGSTSGVRTVYLWIQDRAGNISSIAQDSISLDIETPQQPGTPTTNEQFFPSGTYTLSWDASVAASGIEWYEVQECRGTITPDTDDWDKANTYRIPGTVSTLGFKNKKHGDSFWYRVRSKNNVGIWSTYSNVSEEIIIAELFGTNTAVLGSSTDGRALVNIPQGILTVDTYLIIGRDPLNNPRVANPEAIRNANSKDDVDLSWDRVDNTMTEINAYTCDNGTHTQISTFIRKVKISLRYQDVNQDGFVDNVPYKLDELTLKVYYLNETTKQWEPIETSVVDPVANIVSAEVDHFSTFVLRGIPLRPAAVLGNVRVYPNPYKPNSNPMHNSGIHFGGTAAPFEERLTEQVTIKIFTVTGELVRVIDGQTSGEYIWDTKNEDGNEVASGVYIYQITNEQAGNSFGKVAIVR